MAKAGLVGIAAGLVIWLLRRASSSAPVAEPPAGPAPAAAQEAVEGYCVKERKKVAIKDPERTVTKNGRDAVRGKCPDCGTTIFRFV